MLWYIFHVNVPHDNSVDDVVRLRFKNASERSDAELKEAITCLWSPSSALEDPLDAFLLSWEIEHGNSDAYGSVLGAFSIHLQQQYECIGAQNSRFMTPGQKYDDARSALTRYGATLSMLLEAWRKERPAEGVYGSVAAHWCDRHPDLWNMIETAQRKRASFLQIQSDRWEPKDWRTGGPAFGPKNKHLTLTRVEKFKPAISWVDAAQTAAFALWGDFLAGDPGKIGFCDRCDKPFELRRKKRFCSHKCGHSFSNYASRDRDTAESRRKGLPKAAKELKGWLQKKQSATSDWRKATSDWRKDVEIAFGLWTDSGKKSKIFHEYIVGAETSLGSLQRTKLLASLTRASNLSRRKLDEIERALNDFLSDIGAALEQTRRSQQN